MELLIWHEELGCDDEDANEEEINHRILYYFNSSHTYNSQYTQDVHIVNKQLRFMQGIRAFMASLKQYQVKNKNIDSISINNNEAQCQWTCVTLSNKNYFFLEVEMNIIIGIGVHRIDSIKDPKVIYHGIIQKCYNLFYLFHGSIQNILNTKNDSINNEKLYEIDSFRIDGMQELIKIQQLEKQLRKLKRKEEQNNTDYEKTSIKQSASDNIQELQERIYSLKQKSSSNRFKEIAHSFFAPLLHILNLNENASSFLLMEIDTPLITLHSSIYFALQSFVHQIERNLQFNKPADCNVLCASILYQGSIIWRNICPQLLSLIIKTLQIREEMGVTHPILNFFSPSSEENHSIWISKDNSFRELYQPIWQTQETYLELSLARLQGSPDLSQATSLRTATQDILSYLQSQRDRSDSAQSQDNDTSVQEQSVLYKQLKYKFKAISSQANKQGFLCHNGTYLCSSMPKRSEVDFEQRVWCPVIFPVDEEAHDSQNLSNSTGKPLSGKTRILIRQHEDLSLIFFVSRPVTGANIDDDFEESLLASIYQRIDELMYSEQLQNILDLLKRNDKLLRNDAARDRQNASNQISIHSGKRRKNHKSRHRLGSSKFSAARDVGMFVDRISAASIPWNFPSNLNIFSYTLKEKHSMAQLANSSPTLLHVPLIPSHIMARCWSSTVLEAVNNVFAQTQRSEDNQDIYLHTTNHGWVIAKKSSITARELYAVFPPNIRLTTISDVQDMIESLMEERFGENFF